MLNMLKEFYEFIAKRIFKYFLVQSGQKLLQSAESFCLKLDDDEMVEGVKESLASILESNSDKGTFEFRCMDGSTFTTFTMLVNKMEIIIAAQDSHMTNDFLGATLRNKANEVNKPLLMITANPIDSALSGTRNMSAAGMPFYPEILIADIKKMVPANSKLSLMDKMILEFELSHREEDVFSDKTALYEYRELLAIMSSGIIEKEVFPGFRLFYIDDYSMFDNYSKKQLQREIKKNNDLFERIDRSVRFGDVDIDLSSDFDDKFITEVNAAKNQNIDSWSDKFTYSQVLASIEKKQEKKGNPLQIENDNISAYRNNIPTHQYAYESELFIRNEGSQKAKKRTKNILIFNEDRIPEISLRIDCNIRVPNTDIDNEGETFERDNKALIFKFSESPLQYRKIIIKDGVNKISYVFKICIIGLSPQFMIPTIKTSFVVDYNKNRKKCRIKLLGVGTDLSFNQTGEEVISEKLDDNKNYSCDYKKRLNLYASEDDLASFGSGINISILFADVKVPFVLFSDEAKSQEITGRRILRDKLSYKKGFTISGNLQIQRDSQEYFVKENLQRELYLENCIIQSKVLTGAIKELYENNKPLINSIDIELDEDVKNAYLEYLNAFAKAETIPTLAYLGDFDLHRAAENYVTKFVSQFTDAQEKKPLTLKQQNSLLLGTLTVGDGDEILITPFHVLNIAYQLALLNEKGFGEASNVIIDRLNSIYLLPYIQRKKVVYKVSDQLYSMEWKHYAPVENRKYMGGRKYVPKLVEDKVMEFTSHFRYIFDEINNRNIKINLINMGNCGEILQGIAQYYCHAVKKTPDIDKLLKFEVNVYTPDFKDFLDNDFNYLKERSKLNFYLDKKKLSIESGSAMNDLVGILSKNVKCYFHQDEGKNYAYAHITFYEMESEVTSEMATMNQIATGVSLGGLLSGVPSSKYGVRYRTGFGSKYAKNTELERIAELFNSLSQVSDSGNPYQSGVGISTQIDIKAESKMEEIYTSSNWVVFVDPKVDLDFFCEKEANSDLLIIHYSDQYTSSSGYDAITVTQKSKQYSKVIQEYLQEKGVQANATQISEIINLFNAVNGDWLLRLVSSKKTVGINKDSTFSREKISIVAAIKLMLAYLKNPAILWVPISLEEMLRVSGGAGLSQNDGILSAKNLGFDKGPTSDDLLFVGLHEKNGSLRVYFYPTEVKTGNNQLEVITKAFEQAASTADGLENALNPKNENVNEITYKVNRNFMMQLLINSCKKMQVYHVDDSQDWNIALDRYREKLLNEDYVISDDIREIIGKGAVLSFKKGFIHDPTSSKKDAISFIEMPEVDEYKLILKSVQDIATGLANGKGQLVPLCKQNISDLHGKSSEVCGLPSFESNTNITNNNGYTKTSDEKDKIQKDEKTGSKPTQQNAAESNELNNEEKKVNPGIHIRFGNNLRDGSPVFWNPNDTDQVFHTNTGIIGTMGTGKTQFTKSLITQLYRERYQNVEKAPIGILIFDYKGDYNESKKDFVNATDAKVLKPFHLPFNPLALTKSPSFKPLLPIHTANSFKDTLAKVYSTFGPKQQDTLFQCILDAYHQVGILEGDPNTWGLEPPTFETVYQIYSDNKEIKKNDSLFAAMNKLHQFQVFEGNASNTKSLFNLLQGVVVIDLSGYDSDIQSLVVAITLDLFYAQMQAAGSSKLSGKYRQLTKMILVDEADNFMSQGFPSLKKILKEGREFGVGTILSTQFLKHFGSGEDDYSAYILTWVVHNVADLKASDVDFVFNTEPKSAEEQKLFSSIKQLQKHYSIVKIGTGAPTYIEDLPFWKLIQE